MTREITIPEKLFRYVVTSKVVDEIYKSSHLIHWSDDNNFARRKNTLKSSTFFWSHHHSTSEDIIPNEAKVGYKLTHNGGWYALDPDGNYYEISAENAYEVIQFSVVDQGLILDRCIWGVTNKNKMWLVPERSPQFSLATAVTNRVISKVEWKNVKPGNRVTFKNGIEATYLGEWYVIDAISHNIASEVPRQISLAPKRKKLFRLEKDVDWHYKAGDIYEHNAPKISSIDDASTLTLDECQEVILECAGNSRISRIVYVSQNKIDVEKSVTVQRVDLTFKEASEIFFKEVTFWEHTDGRVAYSQTYDQGGTVYVRGYEIDWQHFCDKKVMRNPSTNFRTHNHDGGTFRTYSECGQGVNVTDLTFFKVDLIIDDSGRTVTATFPY